jgi:hypothetical protein
LRSGAKKRFNVATRVATTNERAFTTREDVMRDYASKSEQIRKLRESRLQAAEKLDAEREADAKREAKPLKTATKAEKQ